MKNKIFSGFEEAVADIPDGARIMVFHWGMGKACAQNLLRALHEKGTKDLTVISHNFTLVRLGNHLFPLTEICTPLILAEQVKKVITSWPGMSYWGKSSVLEKRIAAGEVELELTSHGTLIERIRAGGSGLGGFYTPTGIGTILEQGKEKRTIRGKEYIFEEALRADFSLVRAYKADKMGNLIYHGSIRGSNPIMAMAGAITIAEVDEIVEPGELGPEEIVTPGIFVQRIVKIPEGGFGSSAYMKALFRKTLQELRESGYLG